MANLWYKSKPAWAIAFRLPDDFFEEGREFTTREVADHIPDITWPRLKAMIGMMKRNDMIRQTNGRVCVSSYHYGPSIWTFTSQVRDFVKKHPEYLEEARKRCPV